MTDGTSQGLFIVVAIVIFGIFVVLAYILFEDTLSPAMASMFSDVTEKYTSNNEKLVEDDYEYVYIQLGTKVKITKYIGESKDVVIPNEINGVPVTEIDKGSFTEMGLTSVVLPEHLEKIEHGKHTWEFDGVYTYFSSGAFYGNNIQKVTIPKNVRLIGGDAFAKNPLTEGVFFEEGVDITMGTHVFWATELPEISIPERVVTMLGGNFENARKLTKFTFEGERSGVFGNFWFKGTNLTGRVDVPYGFTKISDYALAATKMSELYIPETVTSLGNRFAWDNPNLTVIHLPKHLKDVIESDNGSNIGLDNVELKYY